MTDRPQDHARRVAMEKEGKTYDESFLRHCVVATGQYQDIVAAMAAEILRLREEEVDLHESARKATRLEIDAEDKRDDALKELTETRSFWQAAKAETEGLRAQITVLQAERDTLMAQRGELLADIDRANQVVDEEQIAREQSLADLAALRIAGQQLVEEWRAEAVTECQEGVAGWIGADATLRQCAEQLAALLVVPSVPPQEQP